MKTLIRQARPSDVRAIRRILKKADLPIEDGEVGRRVFIVATSGGRVVGTAGLETYGEYGLLRSLAVKEGLRGRGLGSELVEEMVGHTRSAILIKGESIA